MSQWCSSDSGILRKNKVDENLDQLLVFGYSCKIFRDDEKALYIDQGKHLIPWMGQESLRIDRYDGRGTLSDLKKFEANREDYDTLRWMGLNESEKRLEELCDNERYYSLEINEEEEEMYKEEVAKRQRTNAIAFDYGQSSGPSPEPKEGVPTVPEKEEEDEPYKPSPVLDVPVDINIPKTVKEYARIEKTALFVCHQGPQMEILIKAKQADNPQFSFLTVQDALYKFYRHILAAFKNGRYQPQCEKKTDETNNADQSQDSDQDSHYLHPSLVSASAKPVTPPLSQSRPISNVPYRPSADCAYSQLVNRIQGTNGQSEPLITQQPELAGPNQMQLINQLTLEQQYHQYYYVQQFYQYWRHSVINSEQGAAYAGLPVDFSQLDPNMQSYIHHLAWGHFVEQHKQMQEVQQTQTTSDNNSYAQIVSNLNKDNVNPYTANVPLLPPIQPTKEELVAKEPENKVKKGLLSLAAAYGSGSDSDTSGSESDSDEAKPADYRVPPSDLQTVIDKMAEYVSKNGDQFETIIKQKKDHRFVFLNEQHEYHRYYRIKLDSLRGKTEPASVKRAPSKPKQKKPIAPVSFSIKKPKEETPKEIKSALPVEDSSEEDVQEYIAPKSPTEALKANNVCVGNKVPTNQKTTYKIAQTMPVELEPDKKVQDPTESPSKPVESRSSTPTRSRRSRTPKKRSRSKTRSPVLLKKTKSRSRSPIAKPANARESRPKKKSPVIDMFETEEANGNIDEEDPILELIDLEKDDRTAVEKAEDAKARQLERKRKATMFLKLKSVATSSSRKTLASSNARVSPSSTISSRRNSPDSVISIRSRSRTRERSRPKSSRRSREHRKEDKKHKKSRDKDRSRSHESSRKRKDRKKKRRRSKSRKKSRKHKRSRSPPRRSRSSSVKSHISINSS